jgi:hypothetical protein
MLAWPLRRYLFRVSKDLLQDTGQFRAGLLQFLAMLQNETSQRRSPLIRKFHKDFPPVRFPRHALDRAPLFEALCQFHGAVMLNEHSRCEFADRRPYILRQSMNRKKELVLLRFKPVFACRRFAEIQESPDLTPKLGEISILV